MAPPVVPPDDVPIIRAGGRERRVVPVEEEEVAAVGSPAPAEVPREPLPPIPTAAEPAAEVRGDGGEGRRIQGEPIRADVQPVTPPPAAAGGGDEPPRPPDKTAALGAPREPVTVRPRYPDGSSVRAAGFPETDVYARVHELGLSPDKAILSGSSALEVVVGPDVRRGSDIDLVVPEGVYRELMRTQRGMREYTRIDGSFTHLVDERRGLDIATSRWGRSFDELLPNSYTAGGIRVAGLADIYRDKQFQGRETDLRDLQTIVDRLHDRPLPPAMLDRELGYVQRLMPEELKDRPELLVAANGLYMVYTKFGYEGRVGDGGATVRTYTGEVEQSPVPATGHALWHTVTGVTDGQRNIIADAAYSRRFGVPRRFTEDDRIDSAVAYAYHDADLGGGRQAINPDRYDEKRSAELAVRHLEASGVTDSRRLEAVHAAGLATGFNDQTKTQDINPARGHIPMQENAAGSDMALFRQPSFGALRRAGGVLVEDFFRVAAGYDRPLGRLVDELNSNLPRRAPPVRVMTIERGLQLIDQYPDYPVTKAGNPPRHMTLREATADHLLASARMCRRYVFPSSWRIGDPALQIAHAADMGSAASYIRDGTLRAADVLLL